MSMNEFERLLELHGPDLERWPAGQQAAARDFLLHEPAAAIVLKQSQHLHRLLDRIAPAPDEAAERRILARLAPLPPQRRHWFRLPSWLSDLDFQPAWPRVAALASVACLGLALGFADLTPFNADPGGTDISTLVLDSDPGTGVDL